MTTEEEKRKSREASKRHYQKHRVKLLALQKVRRSTPESKAKRKKFGRTRKQYRTKLRHDALDLYGAICVKCHCKDKRFLDFDHVNNDGKKQRKKYGNDTRFYKYLIENKPNDIQVLCMNCNWKKTRKYKILDWNDPYHRQIALIHSWQQKARLKCLKHYGTSIPHCHYCGLVDIRYLHLDHIDNNGKEERKALRGKNFYSYLIKNNYPSKLQVLCRDCNLSKV